MIYVLGDHDLGTYWNGGETIRIYNIEDTHHLYNGYLLCGGNIPHVIPHFDALYQIMFNDPRCLFVTNHSAFNRGWALIRLGHNRSFAVGAHGEYYLKVNKRQELKRRRLRWLLIRPVNGLANRMRFLMSSIALGHKMGYRCLLFWAASEGFDDARFEDLFDGNFLIKFGVSLIDDFQFNLLSKYAYKMEQAIPGILNGLQQVKSYSCTVGYQDLAHPVLSITGSNDLIYVFGHFEQFRHLKDGLTRRVHELYREGKPRYSASVPPVLAREAQKLAKGTAVKDPTAVTYGDPPLPFPPVAARKTPETAPDNASLIVTEKRAAPNVAHCALKTIADRPFPRVERGNNPLLCKGDGQEEETWSPFNSTATKSGNLGIRPYGFHIRRGENLSFDISRVGRYLQIARSILDHEPLARFYISTNHRETLEYLLQMLPKHSILFLQKEFLEETDWNFSYLDARRPQGSSRFALADLWCLSRCKKVFGTHDSSFSTVASMWGGIPLHTVVTCGSSELTLMPHNHFPSGWSLVTCCMNRSQNLLYSLMTWLDCTDIDEIVVIDWTSTSSISSDIEKKAGNHPFFQKIRCHRVEKQTSWILTWAYNLAVSLARYDKIIKLDCDVSLDPKFFPVNDNFRKLDSRNPPIFYTGDWKTSSQIHLNGQVLVKRTDFIAINGYNEHLTKYGYDDTDLYLRLMNMGLTHAKFIDSSNGRSLIRHRDHSNFDRICNQIRGIDETGAPPDMKTMIEHNRILSDKMKWDGNQQKHHYLFKDDAIFII